MCRIEMAVHTEAVSMWRDVKNIMPKIICKIDYDVEKAQRGIGLY